MEPTSYSLMFMSLLKSNKLHRNKFWEHQNFSYLEQILASKIVGFFCSSWQTKVYICKIHGITSFSLAKAHSDIEPAQLTHLMLS